MSARVGVDCKMYYNAGSLGAPIWVEIDLARDVTLNLEFSEADAASRRSIMKAILVALVSVSIEFDLIYDTVDTAWAVLLNAFLDRETIEIAMMDGPITTRGSQGLRARCDVVKFSRNEKLEDTVTNAVTIKPTAVGAASWITIGSMLAAAFK